MVEKQEPKSYPYTPAVKLLEARVKCDFSKISLKEPPLEKLYLDLRLQEFAGSYRILARMRYDDKEGYEKSLALEVINAREYIDLAEYYVFSSRDQQEAEKQFQAYSEALQSGNYRLLINFNGIAEFIIEDQQS